MAEKKMTQVQALEIAIAEIENEEARGILAGMLEKKRAPRKPRVNKAAIEFAEKVAAFMEGFENPLTNAEIAAGLSNGAEKGEDAHQGREGQGQGYLRPGLVQSSKAGAAVWLGRSPRMERPAVRVRNSAGRVEDF